MATRLDTGVRSVDWRDPEPKDKTRDSYYDRAVREPLQRTKRDKLRGRREGEEKFRNGRNSITPPPYY